MTKLLKASLCACLSLGASEFALAQADDFTVKLGGRLHIEYTAADFDDPDGSIDATEIRRARLKASGNINSATKYKLELNHTTGGDIDVEDAYVQWSLPGTFVGDSKWKLKVGHFKTQNSFEEDASSNTNHIIERAAFTDAFELNRRAGVELATSGDNYVFKVGAFTNNANADAGLDEGRAFSARGVYNPIKTDKNIVHLGASWRYRDVGDLEDDGEDALLRFRQRPFTHVTGDRIVQSDRFAESDHFYGLEFAAIHNKKFWGYAEYAVLDANGGLADDGTEFDDASFDAFSAEIGYIFGGQQGYKGGKLSRTKVDKAVGEGGWGALSIAARYDTLDLSEAPADITGTLNAGEVDTFAVGVNWWTSNYSRIALSYFDIDAENGRNQSARGIVTRLQLDF